jgi:indolepyruvate ferredoxin oxidoreductase, beta subunit
MSNPKEPYNLIISGVGGQGNILASGLAALAATAAGFNVVVGETYGASQRGGSVMSHIRLSAEKEYGPLVPYGQADVIVGFEPLEALRVASKYAHAETVVIVNTTPVYPVSVIMKETDYPEVVTILDGLRSLAGRVYTLDATALAREAGDPRAQNIVMINALAACPGLPLARRYFEEALEDFLSGAGSEQRETNRRAFGLTVVLSEAK